MNADAVTFTAVLSACAKSSLWQDALQTLQRLKHHHMQPGPLHIATVLDACAPDGSRSRSIVSKLVASLHESIGYMLQQREGINAMESPQTQAKCQEITKHVVAGMECLSRHTTACEREDLEALFDKVVYQPVLKRLNCLVAQTDAAAREAILTDGQLEELYGFGARYTSKALADLGLSTSDPSWHPMAQQLTRQALRTRKWQRKNAGVWPARASAQMLVVWCSYEIYDESGLVCENKGKLFFSAKTDATEVDSARGLSELLLASVFVEHDRSMHAERHALLEVANLVERMGSRDVHGNVRLYAVHTPCISCLAVFCQFRSLFPQVVLHVQFDDWSATRQALVEMGGRHASFASPAGSLHEEISRRRRWPLRLCGMAEGEALLRTFSVPAKTSKINFVLPQSWRLAQWLGSGAYANVAAFRTDMGKEYAVKKVERVFDHPILALRTLREVRLLAHLQHPNLLHLHELILHGSDFKDAYLCLERMDGDLHVLIHESKHYLSGHQVQCVLYQMLRGLLCLRCARVIHRDLKPRNVLVRSGGQVKIGDLGMARGIDSEEDGHDAMMLTEYVVTRHYRAPEVVLTASRYTYAVDMWSAGCILGEMLTRRCIFEGKDSLDQVRKILGTLGFQKPEDFDWIPDSSPAKKFVQICNKSAQASNEGLREIVSSWGMQSSNALAVDLMVEMLRLDPARRLAVDEALEHGYLSAFNATEDKDVADARAVSQMDWSFDKALCFDRMGQPKSFEVDAFRRAFHEAQGNCEATSRRHHCDVTTDAEYQKFCSCISDAFCKPS
ncbi:MPK2 [Symbiodinium sp. KB8]|nr:MPK2 [Symbiodinium sp. KB8]